MDISHITSHTLRNLLSLTDKKDQLLKSIEDVENEIAKALRGTTAPVVRAVDKLVKDARSPKKAVVKKTSKARPGHSGALKNRILDTLEQVGSQGMKVKDLANAVASSPGNISTWLSTTGKSLTVRVGPGRYAIRGSAVATKAVPSQANVPAQATVKSGRRKNKMSPEGRARIAAAMRERWAKHRSSKASVRSTPATARSVKGSKRKGK